MLALRGFVYFLYIVVPVCGVALNCFVFCKLIRVARRSGSRFETTSGLPLSAMSLSDSICLLAQFAQALFHFYSAAQVHQGDGQDGSVSSGPMPHLSLVCKVDLYLMHSTSAFSVWCWLVLSVLRYIAVFHPFKYRTIWRQPRHALKGLAFACLLSESWILYFVVYDSEAKACTEDKRLSEKHAKTAHMMDILVFYAVPSLLRIVFDSLVLFRCYSCSTPSFDESPLYDRRLAISAPSIDRKNSSFECDSCDGGGRGGNAQLVLFATLTLQQQQQIHCTTTASMRSRSRRQQEQFSRRKTAMILRSLLISAINLLCNLPSHLLRTWLNVRDEDAATPEIIEIIEPLSQILYFSQFACNAFYLSTTIYETSLPPARNAVIANIGRQVSRCESRDCEM